MSYLALARKWRPKTFADTVGQEHVLKALVNALDSERLHHAYMFTGTRGVGKTTIARILAKSLNCEKGVTSSPCGTCSACVEIDEGRFVDLIEVDAASKTKVDDTRELLDNVQYAPTRGRYKVYLIDEVHMLSTSSFNALLKTLEEPPPHVKFLLATTDPQKVPVTVLSRCLQFNLQRLTVQLIGERLQYICDQDKTRIEQAAVDLLARAADGSLRDALSLLDQAIAYCGDEVDGDSVAKMLGTIDRNHVIRILRSLGQLDAEGVLDAVAEIDKQFPDYGRLIDELAATLQKIAVFQAVGRVETDGQIDDDTLNELSGLLSPADVQLYYQLAINGRRDLDLSPDPRSGAEMCFLRMLTFRPASASAPAASGGAAPQKKTIERRAEGKATRIDADQVAATDQKSAASWDQPDWNELLTILKMPGSVRMLASNCALVGRDGKTVRLTLDPRSESYLTRERSDRLARVLSEHFGESLNLDISVDSKGEAETPLKAEHRMADERLEAARKSLESDPNVQTLKNMFGGELRNDTIKPLGD